MLRFSVCCLLPLAAGLAQASLLLNDPVAITHQLRVQPIILQQEAAQGGATATYFGGASTQVEIEGYIDAIWAQAGIDVSFLAPTTYVSSFGYNGYPGDYASAMRPEFDLSVLITNGPVSSDPTVLNVFFVEIVPGFPYTSIYSVNGLSFLNANGLAMFVGSGTLGYEEGLEAIATVMSHEIGHNLGLPHIVESENLMQPENSPGYGQRLTPAQLATVFNGNGLNYLVAVPEPSAGLLGLAALGILLGVRRR